MTTAHEALIVQLVFLAATGVSGLVLGVCLASVWSLEVGLSMLGVLVWNVAVWTELGARLPDSPGVLRGRATTVFLTAFVIGMVYLP
ncbi:hypothetical protein K7W42_12935 [Deinococcus sp. HMF7604]|uniref:hypothetical protein n=1 Tax=Deinococcus betulae TaxID=2873312 RepID=UPI001CCF1A86|nr:hypothetical protein [Deinococcus betulae]MBZ9751762.1 hypothetical protein [Deinococcus betulae]